LLTRDAPINNGRLLDYQSVHRGPRGDSETCDWFPDGGMTPLSCTIGQLSTNTD